MATPVAATAATPAPMPAQMYQRFVPGLLHGLALQAGFDLDHCVGHDRHCRRKRQVPRLFDQQPVVTGASTDSGSDSGVLPLGFAFT